MTDLSPRAYCFAGHRLDTVSRELTTPDGETVALKTRTFDLLLYLIQHRERVVGKDELLREVWPGRVVEENNLGQAVSALRRALGTGAGDHRYVVTVSGHGYRFVAPLDAPDAAAPVPPLVATPVAAAVAPDRVRPAAPHRLGWLLALVALLAVLLVATRPREAPQRGSAPEAGALLAVLPFRDDSVAEARDPVLGLGMAETLIAHLGESPSLRVLSLGSVQRFAAADVDPLQAGMRLGAHYVVVGSTRRDGRLIQVSARLLALPSGRVVWSGTFEEVPERIFTLQGAMAGHIAAAMTLRPVARARHRSACDGGDVQAYRAYLGGRHLLYRPDPISLPKAILSFREAIDRDPLCARAWAGLAYAYRAQAMAADKDPRVVFPKAKAAVDHALAIDPRSAEAYASKGMIEFWYEWNWPAAEASLRHAIALDHNLSEAHFALAHLLNNLRRHEEAERYANNATTLDPLSPVINSVVASFFINTGKFAEASRRLDNVLELDPGFWVALYMRGVIALEQGDFPTAIGHLQRAERACGSCSQAQAMLVLAQVRAGDRAQARQLVASMEARARTGYYPSTRLALAHQALGHSARALDLLERAHGQRDHYLSFLVVDPRWRPLQQEPRFRALVQRMNLKAAAGS